MIQKIDFLIFSNKGQKGAIVIKDEVLHRLKEHINEIREFQIEKLYLFGSVARDQEELKSDIDILIKFKGAPSFDLYMDFKFYLEDLLGRKVDLVTEDAIRAEVRGFIEEDLIRVA